MVEYIPLFIGLVVVLAAAVLFSLMFRKREEKGKKQDSKAKSKSAIIRDSNKRLATNPKDPEALQALADLYYREGDWEKSMKTYRILVDLCAAHPQINEFQVNLRYGTASVKTGAYDAAYKSLVIARTLEQDNFEVNSQLGILEYRMKNYEKAASLLRKANKLDSEDQNTYKFLGLSYFKLHKYKEAASFLMKAMTGAAEDKETLFILGKSFFETGQIEKALKIFSHLRPDPVWGPQACLYSGMMQFKQRQYENAIIDLEIGLKHEKIPLDLSLELKYRLALTYINTTDLSKAIKLLHDIRGYNPEYKDVPSLLRKYSELNSNKNLQIFLISPVSEFITLCRKLTGEIFPKAKVKIEDISVSKSEYADILAEISTKKWEDVILFRYMRTTGQTGELFLRDLQARIKELHAGRGFCITAGTFTEGAHEFVEARLIDLIEKDKMLNILKKMG